MFSFDTINITLAFVGTVTLALGFITYLTETKNRTNRFFFHFVLAAFAWILTMIMYRGVPDQATAFFWARFLYVAAATIPITFLYFSFIFTTEEKKLSKLLSTVIWLPYLLMVVTALAPGVLIHGVRFVSGGEHIIIFDKLWHFVYAAYIDGYFLWIYINLIRKFITSKSLARTHLRYVILGTLLSTVFGVTSNLLLPLMGIFTYNWLGQVTVIFMIVAIFYSISRHNLFKTKVVTTELFVFVLWAFMLGRVILSGNNLDRLVDVALLSATIIIGILLIRSVIKEVKIRERMEALATELATANDRLRVLDQQKSEFLSIASHQLRSPLTAIKGYSSMILEGSFGKFANDKLREAIERIFLSSERLVIIIEDFLNVSRIEQGRMQYDFSTVNLEELASGVIKDLEPNIVRAGLTIKFEKKSEGPFFISADFGKVRQMVTNIIDNAVKYTPKGGIIVNISRNNTSRKVLLAISDTGIGISSETLPILFQKFTRAKGANTVNTQGTGLGLYVVKELMKAHKGNVWVESPGLDKGSTFNLEFASE